MRREQIKNLRELEGAQEPGRADSILDYTRQHGITVHSLQQEHGLWPDVNLDQELAASTERVAAHIRPLVAATLERAPLAPHSIRGFATIKDIEMTHLTNFLQEELQLDSLFSSDRAVKFTIQATTSREVPAALFYSFRAALDLDRPEHFLSVIADPECGFVNVRARQGVSLLEGEVNVVGVAGMFDTLLADIALLPIASSSSHD